MLAGANDAVGRAPGERLWPEWFTDDMIATARQDTRSRASRVRSDTQKVGSL